MMTRAIAHAVACGILTFMSGPSISLARSAYHTSGGWSPDWPKDLEPYRQRATTLSAAPLGQEVIYTIPFEDRQEFEKVWPALLTLKSTGTPLKLRSSPVKDFYGWPEASLPGVRIWAPRSSRWPKDSPLHSDPHANFGRSTLELELFVDGKIVDLNRIRLPADTPIIDNRELPIGQEPPQTQPATTSPQSDAAASAAAVQPPHRRGSIAGIVVSAVTEKPIAGAYVGIGDLGDAPNLTGALGEQGKYAHTETDAKGRFVLSSIAPCEHPLLVTHPEFVRHDQAVVLRPDAPQAELTIPLKPAAKLRATVVDATGKPVQEELTIRLEALDGHHLGRHGHLSSFASPRWIEDKTQGEFLFTGLRDGDYCIDVMHMVPGETRYYGGIRRVVLREGETQEVSVTPAAYDNTVTLEFLTPPEEMSNWPGVLIVTRNLGLLVWDTGLLYGVEDHRLGRIDEYRLILAGTHLPGTYRVRNLPPGMYSFFVGPGLYLRGLIVEVVRGRDTSFDVHSVRPEKVGNFGLWMLKRQMRLDAAEYRAERLCELLTNVTKPALDFEVHPSMRSAVLHLGTGEMSLWEVLERVHLDKGWIATERGEKTLLLGPPSELREPGAVNQVTPSPETRPTPVGGE